MPPPGHIPETVAPGWALTITSADFGGWEQSRKRCPPGSGAHPAASMMKRSMPSSSRETPVCSASPAGVSFVLRGVRIKRDIVENEAQVRRAGTVVQSPPEPEVARH